MELGDESLADCTSLPLMDLPESVDAIGEEAFLNCTALTTVTIRKASFDSGMGNDVFRGCDSFIELLAQHAPKYKAMVRLADSNGHNGHGQALAA